MDKIKYIDMHLHMDNYKTDDIRDDVLYIANSMDYESYTKTSNKFTDLSNVIISLGIHPGTPNSSSPPKAILENILKNNRLIGEVGLDFCWVEDRLSDKQQRDNFKNILTLCEKYQNIPMIHTKGAELEVLSLLRKHNIKKSLIHWYSGPENLISQYLDLGCYFTIGPDILDDSTIYKQIPMNRLFIETDNPTGIPWILNREHSKNDIVFMYQEVANRLKIPLNRLILQIKSNFTELTQKL